MRVTALAGLALGVAVLGVGITPASATHGTAEIVDAIDGIGGGHFAGSLDNAPDSADWYIFRATAGTSVTVTMSSSDFDTHLMLYAARSAPTVGDHRGEYQLLDLNDDHGGSLTAGSS